MKLIFIKREKIATDAWANHFEKPAGFDYQPGQFIEVVLKHPNEDDRGEKRWFTLSSSPTEPDLVIRTRFVQSRRSSFKAALYHLEPGDSMEFTGPDGDFVLPKPKSEKLVWVAGGIGITPFRSQLKYMLDTNDLDRKIILFYGNRTEQDNIVDDLLKEVSAKMPKFKLVEVLSESPPAGWQGEHGYIDPALIKKYVQDLNNFDYYVSGPEPMVDALKDKLTGVGIAEDQIHGDWFPGYTDKF
ncbi:FAD-dependent oxidoreductase [Candidatus Saccharibacteria bacterium]|nr:FAD-dependent oxidoreductase [Candidatus Saccharibacteria bacterium]